MLKGCYEQHGQFSGHRPLNYWSPLDCFYIMIYDWSIIIFLFFRLFITFRFLDYDFKIMNYYLL